MVSLVSYLSAYNINPILGNLDFTPQWYRAFFFFNFWGWEVDTIHFRKILNLDLKNINAIRPIEINQKLPNVKAIFVFLFCKEFREGGGRRKNNFLSLIHLSYHLC